MRHKFRVLGAVAAIAIVMLQACGGGGVIHPR